MTAQWKRRRLELLNPKATPAASVSTVNPIVSVYQRAADILRASNFYPRAHLVLRRYGVVSVEEGEPKLQQELSLALCFGRIGLESTASSNWKWEGSSFRQAKVLVTEDETGAWIVSEETLGALQTFGGQDNGFTHVRVHMSTNYSFVQASPQPTASKSESSLMTEIPVCDLLLGTRKVSPDQPFPFTLEDWGIDNKEVKDQLESAYAALVFEFATRIHPGDPGVCAITRNLPNKEWVPGTRHPLETRLLLSVEKPEIGPGAAAIDLLTQPEFRQRLLASPDMCLRMSLDEVEGITGGKFYVREALLCSVHAQHVAAKTIFIDNEYANHRFNTTYLKDSGPLDGNLELGKLLEEHSPVWRCNGMLLQSRPDLEVAGKVALIFRLHPASEKGIANLFKGDALPPAYNVELTLNVGDAVFHLNQRFTSLPKASPRFEVALPEAPAVKGSAPPSSPWIMRTKIPDAVDPFNWVAIKGNQTGSSLSKPNAYQLSLVNHAAANNRRTSRYYLVSDARGEAVCRGPSTPVKLLHSGSRHTNIGILSGERASSLFYTEKFTSSRPNSTVQPIWTTPL